MSTRKIGLAAIAALVLTGLVFAGQYGLRMSALDPENPSITLANIEQTVIDLYAAPQIDTKTLAEKIAEGGAVVFDVRESEEFEQSHIKNAVHVPPDMTAEQFAAQHGAKVAGKTVVFYCAVGVRSSIMHNRVKELLASQAPVATYNLRGGMFRWFAEGRPAASKDGPATSIHPYDDSWGKLLARTTQSPRS